MKFSTQQLLLIILSTILLTLAVLRFTFLRGAFDIVATVVLIVVALCGIYGAWKLEQTALLIFFIAMVIMFILDAALLIFSMSHCGWTWCGQNTLAYIVVSLFVELLGAILAHRLRSGHHSHVLIHI
jgi:hypothetical protein